MKHVLFWAGFAWAAPTTLIGLVLALLGGALPRKVLPGGLWQWTGRWGFWGWWYRPGSPWGAMTFGFCSIFNPDPLAADSQKMRRHEEAHTRQAMLLGVFFLPAYGLLSLWALATRKDAYRGNLLEIAAYAAQGQPDRWG